MRLVKSSCLLLVIAGLGGCPDDPPPEPPPPHPPYQTCLPDCAGTRSYDAVGYDLHARFDWKQQKLIASENVTVEVDETASRDGRTVIELDSEVTVSRIHADQYDLAFAADPDTSTLRVDITPLLDAARTSFTVEYEAPVNDALVAPAARDDDPVPSHVVYTNSEPIYGRAWLVAKHDPADRALWSVELAVAPDEDVVANGTRILDCTQDGVRTVRYEIDRPLPTYLMAFAAGALEHTDRDTGGVPLSVWHRRGLPIDPAQTLDEVADAMATFERLIGPYPWDTYSVVLLPDFPGGMENATITFNSERSGFGNNGFSLNAHELAHHWFGDWVTMHTYDDLWVKEGMATLLAVEAQRARRDDEHHGRLFGGDFNFWADDAIVDPSLTGIDKYTTGPYERAAWLITQIRVRVGEEAFWKALRDVLDEHALDSIDGESFVRSFPGLDETTIQRLLASLDERGVPAIETESAPVENGTQLTFTLRDPTSLLIAPVEITVVDSLGAATVQALTPDVPLTVVVPAGGYLAPDERDVHPAWGSTFEVFDFFEDIEPFLMPTAPDAQRAFATRSAAHQERAMWASRLVVSTPAELLAARAELDSAMARAEAVFEACDQLSATDDVAPWLAAVTPLIQAPAEERFVWNMARCGVTLPTLALADELAARIAAPTPATEARLEYLISADYGAAESLALIGRVATTAPNLALRDLAINRLAYQGSWYSPIPNDQLDAWRQFFRARLDETTSPARFNTVQRGVINLRDVDGLPALAATMRKVGAWPYTQRLVVCGAYRMTLEEAVPEAWTAFQDALQPWTDLAPATQAVLADPTRCVPAGP